MQWKSIDSKGLCHHAQKRLRVMVLRNAYELFHVISVSNAKIVFTYDVY
jgi:hypothetical protein